MNPTALRPQLFYGALLWLSLLLAGVVYGQGLGGMFFVDDYENLEGLSNIAAEPGLETAVRYATSGFSSNLGRPLSLASFALQYRSWPDAPADFIYVNILLHLFNACLLFWALVRTFELAPPRPGLPGPALALAATWFWLFASLQSGAVLYVVQRMALLSGTFMLLGLLIYLRGRRDELQGHSLRGPLLMTAGVGTGLALGMLAKENAALFPLLLLCLEYTLLQKLPRSRAWRGLSAAELWLPSLLLAGYVASLVPGLLAEQGLREFTVGERLLSEGRVLFLYLQKFLLPTLYSMHLYYDDLPVSRSLFDPLTTALALAGWIALLAAAVRGRERFAPLAFAVLWFLAAHLLESTVLPLELAFDHRNYVALIGPALALAWYGGALIQAPWAHRLRLPLIAAATGYAAFFAFSLWQTAALWGEPWELAHYWAEQQPDSRRAQRGAAKFFWQMEQPQRALDTYERALQHWPGDVSFVLGMLEIGCAYPKLPMPPLNRIEQSVARFDSTVPSAVGMLNVLVTGTESGLCRRYSPSELWSMVEMVFDTPRLEVQRQNHLLLSSRVAALAHDRVLARSLLDQAIRIAPFGAALRQATTWALESGDTRCARNYLDLLRTAPGISPVERWTYHGDAARFEQALARLPAGAAPSGAPECAA